MKGELPDFEPRDRKGMGDDSRGIGGEVLPEHKGKQLESRLGPGPSGAIGRALPSLRERRTLLRLLLALGAVVLIYFYRIDRPLLWGDEADTGIGARAVLQHGYPIEYYGRNLSVFEDGAELNRNLLRKRVSWSQFYLGALSLTLFGTNHAGLRWLFAFTGLLAFLPIYLVLRPRVRCPALITALVLMAPQTVLFQRNARYYSSLIFLYAVLVWHLSADSRNARSRALVAGVVLSLFFHTQSFAAVCCCASLVTYCLIFRRKDLPAYLLASGIGLISWLVWWEVLGPSIGGTALPGRLIVSDASLWLKYFGTGLLAAMVDLDVVDCFPILLWLGALALLLARGRKAVLDIFKEPLVSLVLINILIQAIATAALFGSETGAHYALLRYMPHLLVFAMVAGFAVLDAALRPGGSYALVCALAVASNLFTFSFWTRPYSRAVPLSWLWPVCLEVFQRQANSWDVILARLRAEASAARSRDTALLGLPPWTSEVLIFYVGDRYIVRPRLDEQVSESVRAIIGEDSYRRLFARPEWIVDTLGDLETVPEGYVTAMTIPSYRSKPDDGTRPELTRHTFPQRDVVANIRILRLENN